MRERFRSREFGDVARKHVHLTVAIPERVESGEERQLGRPPARPLNQRSRRHEVHVVNGSSASHNFGNRRTSGTQSSPGRSRPPPPRLSQSASATPFVAVGTNLSNNLQLVLALQVKSGTSNAWVPRTHAAAVKPLIIYIIIVIVSRLTMATHGGLHGKPPWLISG